MGTPGLTLLYISRDYTTHDRRFLAAFVSAGYHVHHLRLEHRPVAFDQRELPSGVRSVPSARSDWSLLSPFGWTGRLSELVLILRRVKPDVVLAGPLQTATAMIAAVGYRPYVAMSWGSDVLVDANKSVGARWLTRFALRRSAGVLGDCQAVRAKVHALVRYRDEQIVTFPWGIDLDDFRPGPSGLTLRTDLGWEDKVVLISTRTWEPDYAIDVLVRAFGALWRKRPQVRLLLLGDGSQEAVIRGLIASEGLHPVVCSPGRIGYQQLPDYFRSADVYVSSALSDGTSISLLEAMACALPAVVTTGYGNVEWIAPGVNGWLAPPGDHHALADVLSEAVADVDRRRRFGRASVAIVNQRANWSRNFPQLLALFDRVMAER